MSEMLPFVLPGMMFFWVMFLGQGPLQEVIHEKESRILPRILASPVTSAHFFLAKIVRCFLLCGLVLLALMVVTALLFGLHWGNPLRMAGAVVACAFAITGLLALIYSLARTREQANMMSSVILLVLAMLGGSLLFRIPLGDHPLFLAPVVVALALVAGALSVLAGLVFQTEKQVILGGIFCAMILSALGGCWWPIEIVPDAFKTVAACTPSYWALHGLQSILYFGKSGQVLVLECPILLGFAVACGLLAVLLLKLLSLRRVKAPVHASKGSSAAPAA